MEQGRQGPDAEPSSEHPWNTTADTESTGCCPCHVHCSLSLSWTLALGPGLLICIVGFLAWGVPFIGLQSAITPLAQSVRTQVLKTIAKDLLGTWERLHNSIIEQRLSWDVSGQPSDAFADAEVWGRQQWPLLLYNPGILGIPVYTLHGPCIHLSSIFRDPQSWAMDRQNCTHRWVEAWDAQRQVLTGVIIRRGPLLTADTARLGPPASQTTPQQPFTWMFTNPRAGIGDMVGAHVGLFDGGGAYIGRAALTMSTAYLRSFVQQAVDGQSATRGGRLALFDLTGLVVAATHGKYDKDERYFLHNIGDADLEAADVEMKKSDTSWCPPMEKEVAFTTRYFIDTLLIKDPHPSVQPLEWCAVLLSPRNNILSAVDQSLTFAIWFVCLMTLGVTGLSVGLGLIVTRPLRALSGGMEALRKYEFSAARAACGTKSPFSELAIAQSSYETLVDAIHAFGRYVPQSVVQGLLAGLVNPELGMTERSVALAFMDMENFTAMCETHAPEEIVYATSRLFDTCCALIAHWQGTVDKFIGDCIMALWGAPVSLADPAHYAVHAILEILIMMRDKPHTLQNGARVGMRIGMHGGTCLVGNFGATARWDYTAIGDVVNTAARLEPLNKQFGTRCLVSQVIHRQSATLHVHMRPMSAVRLVGKKQLTTVHELLPDPFPDGDRWALAVEQFEAGELAKAAQYFAGRKGDLAAESLLEDIREAEASGMSPPHIRIMRNK